MLSFLPRTKKNVEIKRGSLIEISLFTRFLGGQRFSFAKAGNVESKTASTLLFEGIVSKCKQNDVVVKNEKNVLTNTEKFVALEGPKHFPLPYW